jgi:dTDP-4-dehydrorhamnose 3,5-epimerase
MKTLPTELPGLVLVETARHPDARGYLLETWKASSYVAAGIDTPMLQDNVSFSYRGVLRGLHFQHPHDQAKLVGVMQGEIYDVAVDVRAGSPTFGRWFGTLLSQDNGRQLFIPTGFAHGFCVLSETALVSYKCSAEYHAPSTRTLLWSDPQLGIDWPVNDPLLSEKDAMAPTLAQMPLDQLPRFDAS